MISARTARLVIVAVAVIGLCADQVTKAVAVASLDPDVPVRLLGGLVTLRLIRNPGAAFSLGENVTIVFSVLAVAALTFVCVWLAPRVRVRSWAIVTGLLVAGIAGNFIDRVFREPAPLHGHVVDFISLPYFAAIFNVADMCLTCAAAAIFVMSFTTKTSFDGTVTHRAATPPPSAEDEA